MQSITHIIEEETRDEREMLTDEFVYNEVLDKGYTLLWVTENYNKQSMKYEASIIYNGEQTS